jgi:hypothetical protein
MVSSSPLFITQANETIAVAQEGEVQSKVVCDADTKICYSSYSDTESGMTFGVAFPKNVTDPYDAIIKITAPVANTWAGFSWGGNMVWNPLSVAWPNGKSGTISARFALYVLIKQYDQSTADKRQFCRLAPRIRRSRTYIPKRHNDQ